MLHIFSLINLTDVLQIFICELHDAYIIVWVSKELQWIDVTENMGLNFDVFFLKELSYLQSMMICL